MKAVAYAGPRRLELLELPDPEPGPGEAVIAVSYCGVCGSDLHEYESDRPSPRAMGMFQPVMGHELSGRVAAVGQGVDGLRGGDPVAVHPGGPCGRCYYCARGRANLCQEQPGLGYRVSGGYAEYVRVRADQAIALPDESFLRAAALAEPLGVALHALNRGALEDGESLLVTGGGPIGLLTVLAARHKNARTVVVSEPSPLRRELAQRLGADIVVNPNDGVAGAVRGATEGRGCDIAVECAGVAPSMNDCLASTRRGGRIVVAGAFTQPYEIDLLMALVQEHAVIGAFGYAHELHEAVELIASHTVDVEPLVSEVVTLEELPDAFERLSADRNAAVKVLVKPN